MRNTEASKKNDPVLTAECMFSQNERNQQGTAMSHVKVGQKWSYEGQDARTVEFVHVEYGSAYAAFEGEDGRLENTENMTPDNGWELVQDAPVEVKVGQVWRPPLSQMQYTVVVVQGDHLTLRRGGVTAIHCYRTRDLPAEWTLVQDVAGSCPLAMAYAPKPAEPACDAVQYRVRNPETGAFVVSFAPIDPCAAALARLPVSGAHVEEVTRSFLDFAAPNRAVAAAKADLRKRVATLRQWPVCPTSGVAYEVRTEVWEEDRGYAGRDRETLRTWQAHFTCPTCEGKGEGR